MDLDNSVPPRHFVVYESFYNHIAILIVLLSLFIYLIRPIINYKKQQKPNMGKSFIKQSKIKKKIKTDSRINVNPISIPMQEEISKIEVPILPGKTSNKKIGKFKYFNIVPFEESKSSTLEQIFKSEEYNSKFRQYMIQEQEKAIKSAQEQKRQSQEQRKKQKMKEIKQKEKEQEKEINKRQIISSNRVFDDQKLQSPSIKKIESQKENPIFVNNKKSGKIAHFLSVNEPIQQTTHQSKQESKDDKKQINKIPQQTKIVDNKPKIENQTKQQQEKKVAPLFPFAQKSTTQNLQPNKTNQKSNPKEMADLNLTNPADILQKILQFSRTIKKEGQIDRRINSLQGAVTSLQELLISAKAFIAGINHGNLKQVDTFCIKVWQFIIFTSIRNLNKKSGTQRMPPNRQSQQVFKNVLNKYILFFNLYRAMGYQRMWLIIFGKTLDMLSFIYKRNKPIKSFKELQLIKLNYIGVKKEIVPLYMSRIDYLLYFLIGLTTLDPIQIFKQVAQRTGQTHQASMNQVINLNYKWQYREFWCLTGAILENKNQSYFKPIVYSNILALIYPQVRNNKKKPNSCIEFMTLYNMLIVKSNKFMQQAESYPEMQALKDEVAQNKDGQEQFEFDGEDLLEELQNLCSRTKQKERDINKDLKLFQTKASILYYYKSYT